MIRRVWFMRGQRQPVIFVPLVTATGQAYAGEFALPKKRPQRGKAGREFSSLLRFHRF
jgi:hypothetical protein